MQYGLHSSRVNGTCGEGCLVEEEELVDDKPEEPRDNVTEVAIVVAVVVVAVVVVVVVVAVADTVTGTELPGLELSKKVNESSLELLDHSTLTEEVHSTLVDDRLSTVEPLDPCGDES